MTLSNRRRGNARRAAVLLPVVGLLAAACGGDSDDSNGDAASGGNGGDQAAESCYEGETATFQVPFSPGGGYDTIARGMAPYLEEELGATVVVENVTGAGGLIAANELFNAEPDGLTFAIVNTQGILGAALAGAEGVSFDPQDFTLVARLAEDARVMLTGANTDLASIDDVLNADSELQWATAGVGAADNIDANVVPTILGIEDNVQIVTGFEGSSETELAVTAGEVDLGSGTLGTRLAGIEAGDQRALLLMGRERAEELPDVPALLELDLANEDLAEAYISLQESGRSIFAPPGLEANCLEELQTAFQNVLEDPAFQEEIGGSVDVPFEYTSGEELQEAVDNVLDAPDELVTLLENAYQE
jgi:tripartite-type tricarboxylate transporter receptor subunit TctC